MPIKKLTLIFPILLLCAISLVAQDFSEIDARARKTPIPKKQDIGELATALTGGLKTEK